MSINFDIVISSDDYSADMSAGLETMKGACEATTHIANTILQKKVSKKLTKESKVRNRLKRSFKGSFGMVFSLDTTDVDLKKKMNQIGQQAFSELISYFISEALYRESVKLSKKADSVLKELGDDIHDELIEQLQKSSLHNLHSYSNHFGKDVKLRYRKSRVTQTVLAHVDRKSYKSLVPKTDNTKITIEASITRFNINTGNGRLLIKGDDKTVAFGFLRKYKDIQQHHKKTFTSNLDKCNGIPNDNWETLKLECTTLKNSCNEVVKYLIRGVL